MSLEKKRTEITINRFGRNELKKTLTSGASGTIGFSGGDCTNCGVIFNANTNQAVIQIAVSDGVGGFQFLDLGGATPTFEPPFASQAPGNEISENVAIDPVRNLLLSPSENENYESVKIGNTTSPRFFERDLSGLSRIDEPDSASEDCTTGVALAADEFTGNVYLADLNQATYTPGSPAGTWKAPDKLEEFPEFDNLSAGTSAVAVAGGSHIAMVNGEYGGSLFGAVKLPTTLGTGGKVPAATDYIACNIPDHPKGNAWETGYDPHTTTAYVSPNTGDAMAMVVNQGPTYVAVIDLTELLDPAIVPRVKAGFAYAHTCDPSFNLVQAGVVRFIPVP